MCNDAMTLFSDRLLSRRLAAVRVKQYEARARIFDA
jgi:hypothetical protein